MKMRLLVLLALLFVASFAAAQNELDVVSTPACVQSGSFGMQITMDGSGNETYVQAGSPNGFSNETVVRSTVWVNFDDNDGLHGIRDFALAAFGPAGTRPFRLMSLNNANQDKQQVRLICQRNCAGGPSTSCPFIGTGTLDLDPGWNQIQVEWTQGSAAPAPADSICGLANITTGESSEVITRMAQFNVQLVRLGRTGGGNFHPSASGSKCFDDVAFFRTLAP